MECLIKRDGELWWDEHFLSPDESSRLFDALLNNISWQTETYTLYGKPVTAPRLVSWIGDENAIYRYSGITHYPQPWLRELLTLRERMEAVTSASFNSVLANYYRNENDSLGWHADNEKELGKNPTIASVSLGETRLFQVKHNVSGEVFDINLNPGCLLVMRGEFQQHWKHRVPKLKEKKSARINLTFRLIS